jgi:hypothetical protein
MELIQYIIPTKKLLFQWKIVNNNRCNFCGNEEDICQLTPIEDSIWLKSSELYSILFDIYEVSI